jgi:hypothetical protein
MIYLTILLDWTKAWGLISLLLIFLTWVFFLAVMRLREMRDAGKLAFKVSPVLCVFAYVALIIGLILDVLVNYIVATIVLMELPKPKELLTTARLCRWYHTTDTSWYTRTVRIRFVRFGQIMLDSADTDGKHIK